MHENNALYPDKINYHNPQHLSVEALELHYRMNASVLKYLELHEGKEIPNTIGNFFKEFLDKSFFPKKTLVKEIIAQPPQPQAEKQNIQNTNNNNKDSSNKTNPMEIDDCISNTNETKDRDIYNEVKKCMGDVLNKVDDMLKVKSAEVKSDKDVIVLSDSDDEQSDKTAPSIVSKPLSETNDVQGLFDKMMEETMKTTNDEQELDSDTSVTNKTVIEVKTDDVKSGERDKSVKVEVKNENKIKSGSETETDVRVSAKIYLMT